MDLLAMAIAPGIAICIFILYRDVFNREPKKELLITFVLGALSVYPAGYIEELIIDPYANGIADMAIRAFIMVALVEEVCKYAVVRAYSFNQKSFDEPLDGIVYALMASMGFATLENVYYLLDYSYKLRIDPYELGWARMFTAVPAHATFGILMGYYMGKAKFDKKNSMMLLLKGLLWAVFFHGTYDLFVFLQSSPEIDQDAARGLLFIGAVASVIVALILSLKHIKTHRLLSQQTFLPNMNFSLRRATAEDIPLIQSLTHQIWPVTYGTILKKEQIDYMLNQMYSEKALQEQMKDDHEFVIAYSGKDPVGFASVSLIAPQVFKLHKIYVHPSQQGKGMGKYIIETVITNMKTKGGSILQLNVNRHNQAKVFYEKIGFAVIGEEDIDIGNGYFMNDFIMEKKV